MDSSISIHYNFYHSCLSSLARIFIVYLSQDIIPCFLTFVAVVNPFDPYSPLNLNFIIFSLICNFTSSIQ